MNWRAVTSMRAACLALVFMNSAVAFGQSPAGPDGCTIPPELAFDVAALPAAAAIVARHERLVIVALGAGATLGRAAGDPAAAYPARLEAHLRRLLPDIDLVVVNAGIARQDVAQMIGRLGPDAIDRHAGLVIWDAGVNDAARGGDVDHFAEELSGGIDRLRAAGIDTILMDMQYAPGPASIIDFDRYQDALARLADLHDLPLFRRYELMRAWSDADIFDFDETDPVKRTATARALYDCIATNMADGIAKALRPPPAKP